MIGANENGPGARTAGAGNHDAGSISNSDKMNTIIASQAQLQQAALSAHYARRSVALMREVGR